MPLKRRTRVARRLRRAATEAEKEMWLALRELPSGRRFRRQHPIGSYVVDFACPGRKLAIELDGGQHAHQAEEDVARTLEIARRGYRVQPKRDLPSLPFGRRGRGPVALATGRVRWARSALDDPHLTPALSTPRGQRGR